MAIKIETLNDLNKYTDYLPTAVVEDINKRVTDWLCSGGSVKDPYIKQQLRFAESVLNVKHV